MFLIVYVYKRNIFMKLFIFKNTPNKTYGFMLAKIEDIKHKNNYFHLDIKLT